MDVALAIPNFNGARYLEETLRSLEAQRPLLRWHFQDGGSNDESIRIARRFAAAGDRVVVEPDAGQPDALNRAFRAMGGGIIGWINSDDLLVEGAVEAVAACFADHPEVDIVYGEVEWIGADGRALGHHAGRLDSLRDALDLYGVWWNGRQWVQPEVFFRRRLFEKTGGINAGYDLAFDFDLWVRMFEAGARAHRLARPLARFRLHDAQKSRRADEAAREIRAILGAALDRKPDVPPAFARRIGRTLEFDRWQAGEPEAPAAGRPLGAALLRHPHWLLLPEVRRRLTAALFRRARLHWRSPSGRGAG